MIVPRNMLNPTLQTVVFGLLPEFATIMTVLYNPLPLGFVRSLHDVHLEFCKRIAILIFYGIKERTVFSLSRLPWLFAV